MKIGISIAENYMNLYQQRQGFHPFFYYYSDLDKQQSSGPSAW
jgi:hypothetical protein